MWLPATATRHPERQRGFHGAVNGGRDESVEMSEDLLSGKGGHQRREGDVAGRDAGQTTIGLANDPRPRWVAVRAMHVVAAQAGRRAGQYQGPDDAGGLDHVSCQVRDTEAEQGSGVIAGQACRRRQHDQVGAAV